MRWFELVQANWFTALFFFAFVFVTALIAIFELVLKDGRKKKITIATLAILLAVLTVGDLIGGKLPHTDWRPMKSAEKASEQFSETSNFCSANVPR